MPFKKSLILFAAFMAFGLGSFIAVRQGFYPAALVNFNIISAKDLSRNSFAAHKYFQNAMLIYGSDSRTLDAPDSLREIKRAVLDKLISDALIYRELRARLSSEFESIAERNIQQFLASNANLSDAAEKLYGLDFPEFKERVLLPQAYQEILEGRMLLGNEHFGEWLQKERSGARVIIFSPDLEWQDSEVKLR